MKRKDKEKDAAFALGVLRGGEYMTLATVNADGTPYCVPLSFVLMDGALYFHCAEEGKKIDNIGLNSRVCVSCARYVKTRPESFSVAYESAVAEGMCETVTDIDEKIAALRALCEKYAKDYMGDFDSAVKKSLHLTRVMKINIDTITGKADMN